MSKLVSNLSWNDRFAIIDHYQPTDEQICKVFNLSEDELSTARQLRQSGTFVPSQTLDVSKYSNLFTAASPIASTPTAKTATATVHTKPQTATKKAVMKTPQKRGRKGDKIVKAFMAVPTTPVSVEEFMKQHNVSLAVLRQSKRFIQKMDQTTAQMIGRVNVKQDKSTKQLMIWREDA